MADTRYDTEYEQYMADVALGNERRRSMAVRRPDPNQPAFSEQAEVIRVANAVDQANRRAGTLENPAVEMTVDVPQQPGNTLQPEPASAETEKLTPIQKAMKEGYTADEINAYLAERTKAAKEQGYTDEEIQTYIRENLIQQPAFNKTAIAAPTEAALSRQPKDIWEAIQTGWNWSTLALGDEAMKPPGEAHVPDMTLENAPWYHQAAGTLATMAGDVPAIMAGGVIGGVPGAFAMPMGLRKVFIDAIEQGQVEGKKEFAQRFAETTWETVKGLVIGATVKKVGDLASKSTAALPSAVAKPLNTTAELAALTEVSARIEGHAPEPQDFLNNAIVLGVMKTITPWRYPAIPRVMKETYVKTGISPEQVTRDAIQGDKGVWQDVLDGRMPDAYKDRVETPPSQPTQTQRIDAILKKTGVTVEKTSGDPFHDRESGSIFMPDLPEAEFIQKYGAPREDVLLHEIGHALLSKWGMTGEIKGPEYADLRKELRAARKDFKGGAMDIAEGNDKMRRHFGKSQELLADGLAVWIKNPEKRGEMPKFTELFQSRLGDIERAMAEIQPEPTKAEAPKEKRMPPLTPEQVEQAKSFLDRPFAEVPQAPNEPSRPTHMNYNRIQTTEEAKQTLARLSEIYEAKIREKQQSPRTWEQSHQDAAKVLADLLNSDEKTVTKFLEGADATPSTTAQLLARKELALGFAEDLMRSRAALAAKGDQATPEDLANFLAQVERVSNVQAAFLGQRADVARALNSLKSTKREADRAQAIIDAVNSYGGPENAGKLVKLLGEYDNPAQTLAFAKKATKATTWEMVVEAWKAGLVSGLRTNEINFLSTAAFTTLRLPTEAITAVIGLAKNAEERVMFSEIPARMLGMAVGLRDGAKIAGAVLRTGDNVTGPKTDSFEPKIPGKAGEVARLPFRTLAASDALLKAVNERGELYALATRQAIKEGHTVGSEGFFARIVDLARNPTEAMTEAAQAAGERYTFTKPLGKGGQAFQRMVKENHLEWMFPFITTPGNIFKETARMTPGMNMLVKDWKADYEKGGIARDRALAEVMIGASIMAMVYAAATEGNLTGNGQPDKRVRATDRAAGWKPYAVKIHGNYYDGYLRMAPIGPLIGLTADAHEFMSYMTEGERDKWARMLAFAFASNVTNQTFMTGMTNFVNVLQDPSRYGPNYFESLASSVVPSIVGQTAAEMDPLIREVNGVREAMIARIPWMREGLMPQKDLFGDPITSPDRLWWGSPFSVSATSPDKVRREASRIGFATPDIPKTADALPGADFGMMDKVRLTPEQRDVFNTDSGKLAHKILTDIVNDSASWDPMPVILKRKMYEKVFNKSRHYAMAQIIAGQSTDVTNEAVAKVKKALETPDTYVDTNQLTK